MDKKLNRALAPLLALGLTILINQHHIFAIPNPNETLQIISDTENDADNDNDSDSDSDSKEFQTLGVYQQSGSTINQQKKEVVTKKNNKSGVVVREKGILNLKEAVIITSGMSSSENQSQLYGLNAGVLAETGASIDLEASSVTTTGKAANAIFATGKDSQVRLSDTAINTKGDLASGISTTYQGSVVGTDISITTQGKYAPAILADTDDSIIAINRLDVTTYGADSPAIYARGDINIENAMIRAAKAQAVVVDGNHMLTLNHASLSSGKNYGVMLYQSFLEKIEGVGYFNMVGGTLTVDEGPVFYITNGTAHINLKNVKINSNVKTLIEASAHSWGSLGKNGGVAVLNADNENLKGNIVCDSISEVSLNLKNGTVLQGAVNLGNTGGKTQLTLDETSKWVVTEDSYLTSLISEGDTLENIQDNGYTIYYDTLDSANNWLEGQIHTLQDGGKLMPIK